MYSTSFQRPFDPFACWTKVGITIKQGEIFVLISVSCFILRKLKVLESTTSYLHQTQALMPPFVSPSNVLIILPTHLTPNTLTVGQKSKEMTDILVSVLAKRSVASVEVTVVCVHWRKPEQCQFACCEVQWSSVVGAINICQCRSVSGLMRLSLANCPDRGQAARAHAHRVCTFSPADPQKTFDSRLNQHGDVAQTL